MGLGNPRFFGRRALGRDDKDLALGERSIVTTARVDGNSFGGEACSMEEADGGSRHYYVALAHGPGVLRLRLRLGG